MSDLQMGGCPSCGSSACVARSCVQSAAQRIAELEAALREAQKDSERIDAIEFYTREPDEWESKYGRCKNGDVWCWTFYAPKGVQGDTRRIIDAASEKLLKD